MKNNRLRISILPLIAFTILAFTNLQQQGNGKGNKENKGQGANGKNQEHKTNNGSQGENNPPQSNDNHGQQKNNGKGNDNGNKGINNRSEYGDRSKGNSGKLNDNAGNGKMNKGKSHKEVIKWANLGNVDWNLNNFPGRKRPGEWKKVTICHQTGSSVPVNITVSENALQAHLNHGDQIGNCTINFGERWPSNYIISRETVYNSYENTWETMSYSEALLRIALDKLLGIKTDLNQNRSRLTSQEIQRREVLIMDLENNTNALNNQLV